MAAKEILSKAKNGKSFYFNSRDYMFMIRISNHFQKDDGELRDSGYEEILNIIVDRNTTNDDIIEKVMCFLHNTFGSLKKENEIDYSSYAHMDFEKCANEFDSCFFSEP